MSLHIEASIPQRDVAVTLDVPTGQTVAIMGPNGAGKSTVLDVAAGLLPGGVRVAGHDVSTTATHLRGIGLLAQEALLLPHLTVRDNVAFGPRSRGQGRGESRRIADEWLERVGLSDLASRRPRALSGGQAQRAAIARALATDPTVLLLDEPMSSLDVTAVPEVRALLREVLAGRTAVLVTHDVLDALAVADQVVVIDGGRVVESGPTTEVLTRPRSTFGARIAGLNLVEGAYRDHTVEGDVTVVGEPSEPLGIGDRAVAVFAPAAVAVHLSAPSGSPRNVWPAEVQALEPLGDRVRIRTDVASADVTPSAVADLQLAPGLRTFLSVKANAVAIHPAHGLPHSGG